jgi:hypothetical protein
MRGCFGVHRQIRQHFADHACEPEAMVGAWRGQMFEEFGRMVVPELQRRGINRREYASTTMRGNPRS